MSVLRFVYVVVCFLSSVSVLEAWGFRAHRMVALIAYADLTPEVRSEVLSRLGEISIEEASTWADQIRDDPGYEHTKLWHYATVPDGESYDYSSFVGVTDIIAALEAQLDVLRCAVRRPQSVDKSDELMALRMVIHLVGDLHQPLHVGNGKDRGGNEVMVRFFGEEMNLHYVWDRAILDTQPKSIRATVEDFRLSVSTSQRATWLCGASLDWMDESISYRSVIYSDLPYDSRSSVRYYRRHLPLIEERILQAGLRLAMLLNDIYS